MRTLSLSLRTALNAEATDQLEVFLLTVSHPSLLEPLRFSSDPTARIGLFNRGSASGLLLALTSPGTVVAMPADNKYLRPGRPVGLLLALTHPGMTTDMVSYGTVSRGKVFNFLPLSLALPDDSEDAPPSVKIVIDGVTREMIPLLRSASTPPTVLVEMVLASAPDVVEVDLGEYDLINASYDALQVTIDLAVSALASEPFPSGTFTPSQFRGLF